MLCLALSVGGGGYGYCCLQKGHTGSHLEGNWQSINKP